MNKKGLSILEILISAVLLALVVTGLANIFVAAKRYILHSRARVTAAERARAHLDPLQTQVDQSKYVISYGNWYWQPNTLGPWMDNTNVTLYVPSYAIFAQGLASGSDGIRTSEVNKVDVWIKWDERTQQ